MDTERIGREIINYLSEDEEAYLKRVAPFTALLISKIRAPGTPVIVYQESSAGHYLQSKLEEAIAGFEITGDL